MTVNVTVTIETGNDDENSSRAGILTDEHASSSYGIPVIVINGKAYGPADFPGTAYEVHISPTANGIDIDSLEDGRYVSLAAFARKGGYKLSDMTDRWGTA